MMPHGHAHELNHRGDVVFDHCPAQRICSASVLKQAGDVQTCAAAKVPPMETETEIDIRLEPGLCCDSVAAYTQNQGPVQQWRRFHHNCAAEQSA